LPFEYQGNWVSLPIALRNLRISNSARLGTTYITNGELSSNKTELFTNKKKTITILIDISYNKGRKISNFCYLEHMETPKTLNYPYRPYTSSINI
jgi:hypothetical protein